MTRTIVVTTLFFLGQASAVEAEQPVTPSSVAARSKEIFRAHCLECHGGTYTNGKVKILDRKGLVDDKKIIPGNPTESVLLRLITATDENVMPPSGQPRLSAEDIETIRAWIVAGAPDFPADVPTPSNGTSPPNSPAAAGASNEYVLAKLLDHIRRQPPADRRFLRYLSIHHLLRGGATPDELETHRLALTKTINHLSWESEIVVPQPVDAPANTVFVVDLRKLGWQLTPYEAFDGGLSLGKSPVNLFDLVLLEYPYTVLQSDQATFDELADSYLAVAKLVAPIPYVRADWFVSLVTQSPLYADIMQLPFTLAELEKKLEVDTAANIANSVAKRAGLTVSGVSRNNRVVERHPTRYGYYWKSFDFKSNRGPENIFKDPIRFEESGGEMLFSLPNGLNGYYVSDRRGDRLDFAPTEIVVDKFASDRIVRNSLSCLRCHDEGIKAFEDTVRAAVSNLPGDASFDKRKALALYPDQKSMDEFIGADTARFLNALHKTLNSKAKGEPLIPVTRRYLENPLTLTVAAAELGASDAASLKATFRAPAFSAIGLLPLSQGGVVRRDAWEEYFDQAVRALGLGTPVIPLDGTLRRDFPVANPAAAVELTTNKKNNIFAPGDQLTVTVTNRSEKTLFVELIGTSAKGEVVVLLNAKTRVESGKSVQFPEAGSAPIKIRGGLGKEQITLFASNTEFDAGQVLKGKGISDRFIHRFLAINKEDGRHVISGDPGRIVKRTLEIETR